MRKRKTGGDRIPLITIAIAVILLIYFMFPQTYIPSILGLSTDGFVEVGISVDVENGIAKLSSECYEVSAVVETAQALSIQNGINGIIGPRPNAHDIAKDMMKALDIKILMVKITELKENAFYSKLVVRQGNTILNLDARPSDAIAIAARTDYPVPVYFNETLIKEMGKKVC